MTISGLMVSYAQHQEDVVLARVLRDIKSGFYVDVGANDPVIDSMTKHFSDKGWRGINIDPGLIFSKIVEARPADWNFNVAASDRCGEAVFHEFPHASGLSSLHERSPDVDASFLEEKLTRTVPVRTLRDIFAEVDPPTIDFINIDVESHERQVLLGNDWSRWRPRVVAIEATLLGRFEPGHHLWEDILLEARYRFVYRDRVNRFYLREEDEALQDRFYPPCGADQFVLPSVGELTKFANHLEEVNGRYLEELIRCRAELTRCRAELTHGQDLHEIPHGLGRRSLKVGFGLARLLHRIASVRHCLRKAA